MFIFRLGIIRVSFRLQQKNRHSDPVLDATCRGAEEQIGQKTMAVCAHRNQIATIFADPFHYFGDRVAVGEFGINGNSSDLKFGLNLFQVGSVFGDFGTDGV